MVTPGALTATPPPLPIKAAIGAVGIDPDVAGFEGASAPEERDAAAAEVDYLPAADQGVGAERQPVAVDGASDVFRATLGTPAYPGCVVASIVSASVTAGSGCVTAIVCGGAAPAVIAEVEADFVAAGRRVGVQDRLAQRAQAVVVNRGHDKRRQQPPRLQRLGKARAAPGWPGPGGGACAGGTVGRWPAKPAREAVARAASPVRRERVIRNSLRPAGKGWKKFEGRSRRDG
jgi:hypothetical protein